MTAARKIIALLIIIFVGLPILFGVIWVVGLTKASVSSEFISDLPREIIDEIPEITEEIFQEAQDEKVIRDDNTRAWFEAAARAGVTPKQLMEEIGLLDWLENELSESFEQVGEVLRGERRPRPITLDLRPLKDILLSGEIDRYLLRVLENLPPCDEEENSAWFQIARKGLDHRELPACRPDLEIAREALTEWRIDAVDEMDNEIEIFEDVHFLPFGISRTITVLSYSLFVIPAIFIFIGALIAATSPASFFRWSGISIFLGALPALLLSFFAKHVSLWALSFAPYSYQDSWSSELNDLILEKTSWIPMRIIDQLFSPVISVAAIVCVIGIVLFVISLMVRGRSQTRTVRTVQAPAATPESKTEAPKAEVPEKAESVETESKEAETQEPQKPKPEPTESEPESEPEEIKPEEIESEEIKPKSDEPKKPEEE
jgi:hypothetical protein